jgi:hypothetical protein
MTFLFRHALAAVALALAPAGLAAQGWGAPPTDAQCDEWATGLTAGGQTALYVVTYGNIPACPSVAPGALAGAIRAARATRDTAYLGGLAGTAAQVRDPAVFAAALEVADDGRASNESRVLGLLVAVSSLGSSPDVPGYARPRLFTQALPAAGICGFEVAGGGPVIDNPLPADAERRAARVFDGIRYANGEPALVQNLARCARSVISVEIPPQVDVSQIRVDHVCGNTFRVQNHTGASLILAVTTTGPDGVTETEDVQAPAKGGWTQFTAPATGPIQVSYDGAPVATVANAGRGCGGGG